ncbi:MAG: hypothetical protein AAGJ35_05100, partial [Myxococcota bacterium]
LNQPLKAECEHFLECLAFNKEPRSDGYSGYRVVKVLEAANQSIVENSREVDIHIPTRKELLS